MRSLVATVLLTALCSLALAETIPPRGSVDSRVRTVAYNRDEVYRLHGRVGEEIHIEFEAGERFVALSGGDVDALSVGAERNSVSIKPRAIIVDSNFTIITSERYYHIAYTAGLSTRARDRGNSIYSLRFTYPTQEGMDRERAAAQRRDALLAAEGGYGPRNTRYWFCGNTQLKPIEASDNGVHTRLRFAEHTEWPAVFVREADGTESLVNFSVQGRDLIVHRVAREWVLRRGTLTGCVVNRGFAGGAGAADSGTVTPQVQRLLRGTAHD